MSSKSRFTIAAGSHIGAYEVLGPIGAGGMGEVYRARDTRLGREVALKLLPVDKAQDPAARERIEREARIVASLNHPNILALHDIGSSPDGAMFLVTELVDGEPLGRSRLPLRKCLVGGPQALSPREVVRMFEAAGAGEIATESLSEADLEAQMNAATDSLQKSFAGLMLQYAAGDVIDPSVSSRLFPFQMTSVRDYITAQLAARG